MSAKTRALQSEDRLLSQRTAAKLRRAILEGEFEPGARLRQDELSDRYNISSAPLREALRNLEAEGLVEHLANRGTYVLGISREELLRVVAPTRIILEMYAIERALAIDREGYLDALATSLDRMQEAASRGDLHAVNDADVAFHQVAIDLCGEPHTIQLWRSVIPRLHAAFTWLAPQASSPLEIVEEHSQLLKEIVGGDLDAIAVELTRHATTSLAARLDSSTAAKVP